MNDDKEREEIEIILPRGMRAKLEARAAKRGLEPAVLLDEWWSKPGEKGRPIYKKWPKSSEQ